MKLLSVLTITIAVSTYFIDIQSASFITAKVAPVVAILSSVVLLLTLMRFFVKAARKPNVSLSQAIWFQNKDRYSDNIDFNKLGNS